MKGTVSFHTAANEEPQLVFAHGSYDVELYEITFMSKYIMYADDALTAPCFISYRFLIHSGHRPALVLRVAHLRKWAQPSMGRKKGTTGMW